MSLTRAYTENVKPWTKLRINSKPYLFRRSAGRCSKMSETTSCAFSHRVCSVCKTNGSNVSAEVSLSEQVEKPGWLLWQPWTAISPRLWGVLFLPVTCFSFCVVYDVGTWMVGAWHTPCPVYSFITPFIHCHINWNITIKDISLLLQNSLLFLPVHDGGWKFICVDTVSAANVFNPAHVC